MKVLAKGTALLVLPDLFGLEAAAKCLDCSTKTLRRRIQEGSLPAQLEGGTYLIARDDFFTAPILTTENAAHLAGIRSDSLGKRVAAGKLSYQDTPMVPRWR